MNNKIAGLFKTYLETLPWSDKVAGLVQTANIRVKKDDSAVEKSYPVSCDVTAEDCIKGEYHALTPDSKKKSVLYFEDKGVSFVERMGARLKFQSSLRLVGWLNLKLINNDCDPEGCGTAGDYVIDVIQVLPTTPIQTADFISIFVSGISEAERSVDIFSKYTYNENATQYLLHPYSFFALDLEITFVIPC